MYVCAFILNILFRVSPLSYKIVHQWVVWYPGKLRGAVMFVQRVWENILKYFALIIFFFLNIQICCLYLWSVRLKAIKVRCLWFHCHIFCVKANFKEFFWHIFFIWFFDNEFSLKCPSSALQAHFKYTVKPVLH
jgi:hypothetical protein